MNDKETGRNENERNETERNETERSETGRNGTGRGLRYGSFSLAVTLCFIAAVILLNAVVSALGDRYSLRLDLTKDQIFKLSPESIRFLDGLDQDVTLYVLTSEDYFSSGNLYYIQAQEVLRQYAARTPRITLEYIDLPRNPGFEKRFPEFQLSSYMIVLQCGDRTATVAISDLFNTDFDPYYYTEYITSSKAEQALTSAILGLTTVHQVTVAIVEGFGESSTETLENILKTNSFNPVHQNILTEEIDPEAEIAVISAPMRDYTQDELRKLDRFLQNGGDYGKTLIYFPAVLQPPTPNIDSFLADWGISVDEGVVYQTNYAKLLSLNNYWSVADYNEQYFAQPAIERRLLTAMPESRPLSILFESGNNLSVSAPLIFTDTAVVAPLESLEGWTPDAAERRGPMPAFIVSTGAPYNQRKDVGSNLLVFGSYEFIGPSILTSRSVGNSDYILNVVNILSDREDTVYIAPKTIGARELPVTGDVIVALGIVFVAALPLCVLIVGGVVYFRRRRL